MFRAPIGQKRLITTDYDDDCDGTPDRNCVKRSYF
jgi:hypothetical protein